MLDAVADCMVSGHEPLVEALQLPEPDERHVLAAAIRAGAQAIVTLNLRDFPPDSLGEYEVEAIHPDDFVLDLLDLSPTAVVSAVQEQTRALKTPPRTLTDVLETLRDNGLVQSVAKLRDLFGKDLEV